MYAHRSGTERTTGRLIGDGIAKGRTATPREGDIYRTYIAWAEFAWLRVERRGMIDPVIELRAMDTADPDRVLVLAAEQDA
jgi:hypothetical protein